MKTDDFIHLLNNDQPMPNEFSIEMGRLIRRHRENAGINQSQLAEKVFRRQATLSDIENGRAAVDTLTLVRIANALGQPFSLFIPTPINRDAFKESDITAIGQELILVARELGQEDLEKFIEMMRAVIGWNKERKSSA